MRVRLEGLLSARSAKHLSEITCEEEAKYVSHITANVGAARSGSLPWEQMVEVPTLFEC